MSRAECWPLALLRHFLEAPLKGSLIQRKETVTGVGEGH